MNIFYIVKNKIVFLIRRHYNEAVEICFIVIS